MSSTVENYLPVQAVYRGQGGRNRDKHVEAMVRQMLRRSRYGPCFN